jgi:hypothetical protein
MAENAMSADGKLGVFASWRFEEALRSSVIVQAS